MENTKGTMSVEDLLRQGRSAEDLMQMLESELATAQAKIDKEAQAKKEEDQKKKQHIEKLETARMNLTDALIKYCQTIGLADVFESEEDQKELVDLIYSALKEYEEEFEHMNKLLGVIIKPKRKKSRDIDIDDIIHDFIAKL